VLLFSPLVRLLSMLLGLLYVGAWWYVRCETPNALSTSCNTHVAACCCRCCRCACCLLLLQVAVVPLLAGLFWFSRRRVLAKVALKKQAQLDFHGEVRWTSRKVRRGCEGRGEGGMSSPVAVDGRLCRLCAVANG
jgi:hypothetical protein